VGIMNRFGLLFSPVIHFLRVEGYNLVLLDSPEAVLENTKPLHVLLIVPDEKDTVDLIKGFQDLPSSKNTPDKKAPIIFNPLPHMSFKSLEETENFKIFPSHGDLRTLTAIISFLVDGTPIPEKGVAPAQDSTVGKTRDTAEGEGDSGEATETPGVAENAEHSAPSPSEPPPENAPPSGAAAGDPPPADPPPTDPPPADLPPKQ